MEKSDVVRAVIDVLAGLQSMSGRPATNISDRTCAIGDLDQFDSLNGVEATVELSERLGMELPAVNVFVNENGTKALTVSEIADSICQRTAGKESLE